MIIPKPKFHRLAQDAVDQLAKEGIICTPDEILWLNEMAEKVIRPTPCDQIRFFDFPVPCGNIVLLPPSIGVNNWLREIAAPWFSHDEKMDLLSCAYALANGRTPAVLYALTDRHSAAKIIIKWAIPWISRLADWLRTIRENGDLQFWAEEVKKTIEGLEPVFSKLTSWIGSAFSFIKEKVGYASAFWGAVSTGEGLGSAARTANQVTAEQNKDQEQKRTAAQAKAQEDNARRAAENAQAQGGTSGGGKGGIGARQKVADALSGIIQQRSGGNVGKGEKDTDLKDNAEYLQKKYEHQYKMVNDPVYRAAHVGMEDDTTKVQKQEQKRWEKKVNRARAQKARGAYGKSNDRIIMADETGKAATAAEQARRELDSESGGFITSATAGISKNKIGNIGAKAIEAQSTIQQGEQNSTNLLSQIAENTKKIKDTIKDAITLG